MELDDEDKLDAAMPIQMADKPNYPYGLCFCLTDKELAKLELDPHDAIEGGIIHIHALARIKHVSHTDDSTTGKCSRIECQIEDLSIESEDEENED